MKDNNGVRIFLSDAQYEIIVDRGELAIGRPPERDPVWLKDDSPSNVDTP